MRGDKTCIIIAGGDVTEKIIPDDRVGLIICADSGYRYALEQGIKPDVLIGDFDSYTDELPEDVKIIRYPVEKDVSDTWAAVQYGREQGIQNFEIYGGCGGDRIDHTIANLQLLHAIASENMIGDIRYGNQRLITVHAGSSFTVFSDIFPDFSVFALSDICRGVSITGAKYPLKDADLTNRFPLGLSNECQEDAVISVQEGSLLLVLTEK